MNFSCSVVPVTEKWAIKTLARRKNISLTLRASFFPKSIKQFFAKVAAEYWRCMVSNYSRNICVLWEVAIKFKKNKGVIKFIIYLIISFMKFVSCYSPRRQGHYMCNSSWGWNTDCLTTTGKVSWTPWSIQVYKPTNVHCLLIIH